MFWRLDMANFEPQWDLIADTNTIQEGQTTYFRLRLKKSQSTSQNNQYNLASTDHLEFKFNIVSSGGTYEERDFNVSIGESTSTLVPIGKAGTGSSTIAGSHVVKINRKAFDLSSATYIDAFLFKIECPQDGIWDGPESLTFNIDSINVITIIDNQVANTVPSGVLGTTTQILNYNTTNEVWLTPGLTTHGDNLYTIGGIGYGAESRLFVQAFGKSQTISGVTNVFMPAYEILTMSTGEMPSKHITGSGTIIVPDLTNGLQEEIPLLIRDINGNMVNSGLKFNWNNGQIVQTMLYDSDPIDAYIKVRIVSVKKYYLSQEDAYFVGKRFRAYQTWIAPDNASTTMHEAPTPKHLYQLKDTTVYPYVVGETVFEGTNYIEYNPDRWYDLGLYNESLGNGIINNTRIFRIIVNDNTGSDISFETDSNLGEIHVGEYFGHTVYPKIVANGSDLITYEINHSTSPNDIRKYGLDMSADGTMIGTAYARSEDFTANDDIPLQFDVVATGKNGRSLTQRFKIRIIRGLGQNFISADIQPSLALERSWFSMIATNAFSSARYYRPTDPKYGVRKVPRLLLKENFVDPSMNWPGLKQIVTNLRNGIVDTVSGAPTPDGSFRLVLGNYKVRSALDNLGNVLYDVLYREVHPEGTQVDLSLNPLDYTDYSNSIISEIYGLRQNIFNVVGEDTINLLTDPTDLNNRGVVVDAINGLSEEMIDTVPRFMNHPYIEDNIKAMYFPCIVVAYLQPGQGEAFFNTLIQNNEHGTLLNYEFEVSGVEFSYFTQDTTHYVKENFTASLKVPNLFQ